MKKSLNPRPKRRARSKKPRKRPLRKRRGRRIKATRRRRAGKSSCLAASRLRMPKSGRVLWLKRVKPSRCVILESCKTAKFLTKTPKANPYVIFCTKSLLTNGASSSNSVWVLVKSSKVGMRVLLVCKLVVSVSSLSLLKWATARRALRLSLLMLHLSSVSYCHPDCFLLAYFCFRGEMY